MQKLLLFLILVAITYTNFASISFAKDFSDVPSNSKYIIEINDLANKNILNGYADGSFKPDNEINRAEFTKIVIESAFPKENGGTNCFKDVKNEWFAPYVCLAKDKKIIDGYGDKTFKPNQPINFAEASKIIANALGLKPDDKYIETWFEKYIVSLENASSIPDSILYFHQNLKRGEMSFIISKALKWDPNNIWAVKQGQTYADLRAISNLGPDLKELSTKPFYSSNGKVYAIEYGKSYILKDSDADSFETSEGFFKDKKHIYHVPIGSLDKKNIIIYDNFNEESFKTIYSSKIGNFVADKDGLYYVLEALNNPKKIDSFNADDFQLIADIENVILFSDKKNLYMAKQMKSYLYTSDDIMIKKLDFVDLASFKLLESTFKNTSTSGYFKDKNSVYNFGAYQNIPITEGFYYTVSNGFLTKVNGVDSTTIEAIQPNGGYVSAQYFKDKNGVYSSKDDKMTKINNTDIETFEIVVVFDITDKFSPAYAPYYLKDKNNIWIINPDTSIEKLNVVDPEKFNYNEYLENKGVIYWKEMG